MAQNPLSQIKFNEQAVQDFVAFGLEDQEELKTKLAQEDENERVQQSRTAFFSVLSSVTGIDEKKFLDLLSQEQRERVNYVELFETILRMVRTIAESTKVKGSAGGSYSSFKNSEKETFVRWINAVLRDEENANYSLIDPKSMDLFKSLTDGIILCKLVNVACPNTISPSIVHTKEPLSRFQKLENLNNAILGAKALGIVVVNIRNEDLLNGRPSLMLGILWQLMRMHILRKMDVTSNLEVLALKGQTEDIKSFLGVSQRDLLVRWINYHLIRAHADNVHISESDVSQPTHVDNLTSDLASGDVQIKLLHQLVPELVTNETIEQIRNEQWDVARKAQLVVEVSRKIAPDLVLEAEDLLSGSSRLNTALMAALFNARSGLDVKEAVSTVGSQLEGASASEDAEVSETDIRRMILDADATRLSKTLPQVRPAFLTAYMNAAESFRVEALASTEKVAELEKRVVELEQIAARVNATQGAAGGVAGGVAGGAAGGVSGVDGATSEQSAEQAQQPPQLVEVKQQLEQVQQHTEQVQQQLEETKQQLDQSHQKLEESHQQLDQTHKQLEQSHQQLEQSNQQLEVTQQQLEHTHKKLENTQQELEATSQQLTQAAQQLGDVRQELQHSHQELGQFREQIEQANEKIEQTQQELEQTRHEFEQARTDFEQQITATREQASKALQEQQQVYQTEKATVMTFIDELQSTLATKTQEFASTLERKEQELSSAQSEIQEGKKTLAQVVSQKETQIAELNAKSEAKQREFEEKERSLRAEIAGLKQEFEKAKHDLEERIRDRDYEIVDLEKQVAAQLKQITELQEKLRVELERVDQLQQEKDTSGRKMKDLVGRVMVLRDLLKVTRSDLLFALSAAGQEAEEAVAKRKFPKLGATEIAYPDRKGWLISMAKKGKTGKWTKRWTLLKENYIFIYDKDNSPTPSELMRLDDAEVEETVKDETETGGKKSKSGDANAPGEFMFKIKSAGDHEMLLSCEEKKEATDWIVAIRKAGSADPFWG